MRNGRFGVAIFNSHTSMSAVYFYFPDRERKTFLKCFINRIFIHHSGLEMTLYKITKTILFLALVIFAGETVYAQRIYKTELKEDVGPNAWRVLKNSYKAAQEGKADYFFVEMNTFGGAVNFADSIRTLLLNAEMK